MTWHHWYNFWNDSRCVAEHFSVRIKSLERDFYEQNEGVSERKTRNYLTIPGRNINCSYEWLWLFTSDDKKERIVWQYPSFFEPIGHRERVRPEWAVGGHIARRITYKKELQKQRMSEREE